MKEAAFLVRERVVDELKVSGCTSSNYLEAALSFSYLDFVT